MLYCYRVIAAATIGSATAIVSAAYILPTGLHWLLAPAALIAGIAEARVITRALRSTIERCEARAAEEATAELIRLARASADQQQAPARRSHLAAD
jgi:hypothetical protein